MQQSRARQRPLVAGNWKMHKTIPEAVAFVRELLALAPDFTHADAVLFPPFTALKAVGDALGSSPIGVGGQTMWYAESGAYTGEISPRMLLDCGAGWVILGHSERRAYCGETDEAVNLKVKSALANGIVPIVAVGESAEDHAAGRTHAHVVRQTRAAFDGVAEADVERCIVAYEPIWAIGTGNNDSPAGADAVMGEIRASVAGLENARILYGGSVKPDNIAAFAARTHCNGGLVGGASLDPASFAALIAAAGATVAR